MNNAGSWVPIPTAIIEEMPSMTAAEALCTILLAAGTYGRNSKTVRLTYADIQKRTMIKSRNSISRALRAVASRGFFRREGGSTWEIGAAEPGNRSGAHDAVAHSLSPGTGTSSAGHDTGSNLPSTGCILPGTDPALHRTDSDLPTKTAAECGPKIEPKSCPNSPEIEPLPLYKERTSIVDHGERERKRARAREDDLRGKFSGNKEDLHPEIPAPRNREEAKLARHPAALVWLEAKMDWPGWEKLAVITRRLGKNPQKEKLRQAREMWMMSGYRLANIHGILDWYEALCQDETWQPFARRGTPQTKGKIDIEAPQSPAMAILFQMKKEMLNERPNEISGLFEDAASGISAPGSWTANIEDLPALPG